MRIAVACLAAGLLLAAPSLAAHHEGGDWSAWADLEEIQVLTVQEDGTPRETTIWILVQGSSAYIRTSAGSAWGDEVERADTIGLRGGGEERTVRATAITADEERERLVEGFRAKYGFVDRFLDVVRGKARIWRVEVAAP